jgi:hypothetical protein
LDRNIDSGVLIRDRAIALIICSYVHNLIDRVLLGVCQSLETIDINATQTNLSESKITL